MAIDYRYNRNRTEIPIAVKPKRPFDYHYFDFETKKMVGIFRVCCNWGSLEMRKPDMPTYRFKFCYGIENNARVDDNSNWKYHALPKPLDVLIPIFLLPKNCTLSWIHTPIIGVSKGQRDDVLYSGLFGGERSKEPPYFVAWINSRGYSKTEDFHLPGSMLNRYDYLLNNKRL